jgi:hypothetical protein
MARVRPGPLCRAFAALVAVAALAGGVPYVLVRFVGWPLPRHVPSVHAVLSALSQHGISNAVLIDSLAVGLWLSWAVLAVAFLAEGVALAANHEPHRVLVAGRLQPFAGALLGAIVISLAASFARSGSGGMSMPRAAITVPIRPPEANGAPPIRAWLTDARSDGDLSVSAMVDPISVQLDAAVTTGAPRVAGSRTYVVREGETLWGIAAAELGDAARWQAIFDLNRGVPQVGGGALESPHWIYPGWVLRLPVQSMRAPEPSVEQSKRGGAPSVAPTTVPTTTTLPPTTVPPTRSPPVATVPAVGPTGPPRSASGANDRHDDEREPSGEGARHVAPVQLPSGSIVGGAFAIGVLGALALARRRRRHAYRYRPPMPGRHLDVEPLGPTLHALADTIAVSSDEPVVVPAEPADANPDHRERPDLVEFGTVGGEVRSALLTDLAGVCFVGEHADSVVRALLCSLLTRCGPIAAEVLATATTMERLVPDVAERAAGGEVPGIRIVPSNEAICVLLEAEVDSRTRQFALDDVTDVFSYRQLYP